MKIGLINTGGTISCVGNPLTPMSAAAFGEACKSLLEPQWRQQHPQLEIDYLLGLNFPGSDQGTLDSTNLQPSDWCLLADFILQHYAEHDAFIILHGTDSMDFSGTALPFLLSSFDASGLPLASLSKPVILTGSQLPLFYQEDSTNGPKLHLHFNTDAVRNLSRALAVAQTGVAEVCLFFDSHLWRGCRIMKTHANHFDAFSSPNYPALGQFSTSLSLAPTLVASGPMNYAQSLDNPEVLARQRKLLAHLRGTIQKFPVMQLSAFPASFDAQSGTAVLADLIRASCASGIRGLVLLAYGVGNFPSGNPAQPERGAIYQALHEANQAGVVIVDATHVLAGEVSNATYAAGAWLPAAGALSPADMTPMAAFAKLMILQASADFWHFDAKTVKTLLQTNLLGEMRDVNQLRIDGNCSLLPGQSLLALDGSASLCNDVEQGPILIDMQGKVLWRALAPEMASQALAGRLQLQADGDLHFYDRNRQLLWRSASAGNGAARLFLRGSAGGAQPDLRLQLEDCQDYGVRQRLYPPPPLSAS